MICTERTKITFCGPFTCPHTIQVTSPNTHNRTRREDAWLHVHGYGSGARLLLPEKAHGCRAQNSNPRMQAHSCLQPTISGSTVAETLALYTECWSGLPICKYRPRVSSEAPCDSRVTRTAITRNEARAGVSLDNNTCTRESPASILAECNQKENRGRNTTGMSNSRFPVYRTVIHCGRYPKSRFEIQYL